MLHPDTVRLLWVLSAIHATGCIVIMIYAFAEWSIRIASDAPRSDYEWHRGRTFVRKATDREATRHEWEGVPEKFAAVWGWAVFFIAIVGFTAFGFWRGLLLCAAIIIDLLLLPSWELWGCSPNTSIPWKPIFRVVFLVSFLASIWWFQQLISTDAVQWTLKRGPWND